MTNKQIDRLLDILDRFAKVAQQWADSEYPKLDETATPEIYRIGERPEPQSREEYDKIPEEGRFERQFNAAKS